MVLSRQQKIAACVLVLYWPVLFILTHIPIPRVVQEANVSDKSLHFLAYLVLTFLIWSIVSGNRKVNWRRAAPWLVLFVLIVYGILDEWLQGYVAGRSRDVHDFYMDLAGALTSLIISSFLMFWPAGLVITATFIFGVTNVTRANLANLLPVTNDVFNLLAYAILTVLWIQCMHFFTAIKAPKIKWLLLALAGPTAFLIIVKSYSVIVGKNLVFSEIIIAFGAIATVVIGFYVRRSVC
jgi:VanZ family protein